MRYNIVKWNNIKVGGDPDIIVFNYRRYYLCYRQKYQFWFCTGSQDLYGDECLAKVAEHSHKIVDALNASGVLPYEVVWKPTLITNELIRRTFNEANLDENCAGVITWMRIPFLGEIMDPGIAGVSQTVAAFPYAV